LAIELRYEPREHPVELPTFPGDAPPKSGATTPPLWRRRARLRCVELCLHSVLRASRTSGMVSTPLGKAELCKRPFANSARATNDSIRLLQAAPGHRFRHFPSGFPTSISAAGGTGRRPSWVHEGVSEAQAEDEEHEADGANREQRVA